jgi:hypothetical protein
MYPCPIARSCCTKINYLDPVEFRSSSLLVLVPDETVAAKDFPNLGIPWN